MDNFLVALILPISNMFNVNSTITGAFVITLPLAVFFLARAVDGLTGGNVSVADAYVADISSDENRSKNFGKMSISSNLGFIVGPALAGILGATIYGEIIPVLAALIVSSVVLVMIIFVLRESKSAILMEVPEKTVSERFFHSNPKNATKQQILRNLNSEMFSN